MERLTAQEARDIYLQNIEFDKKDEKEIDKVMETIHKCLKNGMLRCVIHNDLRNETKKWLLGNGYRLKIDHAHHDESGVWHCTEVTIAWGLIN